MKIQAHSDPKLLPGFQIIYAICTRMVCLCVRGHAAADTGQYTQGNHYLSMLKSLMLTFTGDSDITTPCTDTAVLPSISKTSNLSYFCSYHTHFTRSLISHMHTLYYACVIVLTQARPTMHCISQVLLYHTFNSNCIAFIGFEEDEYGISEFQPELEVCVTVTNGNVTSNLAVNIDLLPSTAVGR